MNPERDLDPSKPGAQLKEDEKKVEDTENQDDGYSIDVHLKVPPIYSLTEIFTVAGPVLP